MDNIDNNNADNNSIDNYSEAVGGKVSCVCSTSANDRVQQLFGLKCFFLQNSKNVFGTKALYLSAVDPVVGKTSEA